MDDSRNKKLLIVQLKLPTTQTTSSTDRYRQEINFANSIAFVEIIEIESVPDKGQLYFAGVGETGREFYCLEVLQAPKGFDAVVISTSGQKAKA